MQASLIELDHLGVPEGPSNFHFQIHEVDNSRCTDDDLHRGPRMSNRTREAKVNRP